MKFVTEVKEVKMVSQTVQHQTTSKCVKVRTENRSGLLNIGEKS